MNFAKLTDKWTAMLAEKSFKARLHYLFDIRKAPTKLLVKLFSQNRTCISRENKLPSKSGRGAILIYARRWQRRKLIDVVLFHVVKTTRSYDHSIISLFDWVDIGRIPNGYFAEPHALASIGTGASRGGKWVELWHAEKTESLFVPAVDSKVTRLKEYFAWGHLNPCIWTIKDSRLTASLKDLNSRSKSRRIGAIAAIADMDWNLAAVPELAAILATEGVRGFDDILGTTVETQDALLILKARNLLARISTQVPQVADMFALAK